MLKYGETITGRLVGPRGGIAAVAHDLPDEVVAELATQDVEVEIVNADYEDLERRVMALAETDMLIHDIVGHVYEEAVGCDIGDAHGNRAERRRWASNGGPKRKGGFRRGK